MCSFFLSWVGERYLAEVGYHSNIIPNCQAMNQLSAESRALGNQASRNAMGQWMADVSRVRCFPSPKTLRYSGSLSPSLWSTKTMMKHMAPWHIYLRASRSPTTSPKAEILTFPLGGKTKVKEGPRCTPEQVEMCWHFLEHSHIIFPSNLL